MKLEGEGRHRASHPAPISPPVSSAAHLPNGALSRNGARILLLAILLLAAFLRFYRLGTQSFWNDEGNSARLAERSLRLIVEGAAGDIHPPGYYLLLHFWRAVFGQSEFALRSLSAVAGLALILATYSLGRRVFHEATGLIAAFFGAISPFAIYYSQEARMYALLAALSCAATWSAFGRLRSIAATPQSAGSDSAPLADTKRRIRPLMPYVTYALLAVAGLYTHYAFAFVLLAHNVLFALWWLVAALRHRPRRALLAAWAGTQAGALLLYLPWLPTALGAPGWSSPGEALRLGRALLDVLRVLTVGITLPLSQSTVALVPAGFLLVAGMWPVLRRASTASDGSQLPTTDSESCPCLSAPGILGASLAVYLLLLIALFFAFRLYKPAWLKFLVIALPPFHILIAHGVFRASSRMPAICSTVLPGSRHCARFVRFATRLVLPLLIGGLTYPSLRNLYFNPAYARDDYRQIAADIGAQHQSGDAIILSAPNQWEVFTYYYPDEDVYPAPYRPTAAKAASFLDPIVEQHRRLFVLYWGDAESDPRRRIESWLAQHAYKAGDQWYGDIRLAIYGTAPLPDDADVAVDARFGDHVRLHGFSLQAREFVPGSILPVTLFWEAERNLERSYKVSVQLLDGRGSLVAQIDTHPGDGLAPTTTWQPGEMLNDRYGLNLAPDLAPGSYTLIVAVYPPESGERLPVLLDDQPQGDFLPLAEVIVPTEP